MISKDENTNQTLLIEDLKEKTYHFNKKYIILFDGDRTLCEPDTSRILNELANIDLKEIKDGFIKYGYTYPGFRHMADIYSRLKLSDYDYLSKKTAESVELYPGVLKFIKYIQGFADIIIITSGVKKIWEYILINNDLKEILLVGGTHHEIDDYIVGRNEKGLISNFFVKDGRIVIAFGDSDVDSLMLQNADHAVIVVNHRNNEDLIPFIKNHASLYQISFKNFYHNNIKITDFVEFSNEIYNLIQRG